MYIVQRTDTALSSGLWNAFSPYQNTAWMAYLAMFSAQLLFMIFLTRVECSLGQRPCSTFEVITLTFFHYGFNKIEGNINLHFRLFGN